MTVDSSNLGAPSFQAVAVGGLSELEQLRASLAPTDATTTRALHVAIFCAALVLHVALAVRLQTSHAPRLLLPRKASQVEIQITRPPTPVVIPEQAVKPPPPRPVASPRPQPHLALPEPVHAAPAVASGSPGLDAPIGDEGTAPPGTGEVAAPVVQAAAPPPPPPPPPAVVEAKEGANYLKNPRPAYPRLAQREGWEGAALLRVRVLPSGRPEAVTVQRSSGHGVLDDAAIAAVKGWAFVPATQGGTPVAGWVNVPIEFRLQ